MDNATINALFEAQAAATPHNTALVYAGRGITYAELNRRANRMAHYLISRGVKKEAFVGVVRDHSPEMVAAILAALKSGAAYVPMEPSFPRARINYIVGETGMGHLFTQKKYRDIFDDQSILLFEDADYGAYGDHDPAPRNDDASAIYVLYTSGTTGAPKGVVVEQRNVVNYVNAFKREFRITAADKMLQNSVCTFDIFTEELYPILLSGGTLVIADEADKSSVENLADLMEREQVSILTGFPYLLSDLNRRPVPSGLRLAISGGDVLRREQVDNLAQKIKVYNTYGPTETTVCVTYYHYRGNAAGFKTIPIGKANYGNQIYILDEKLQPVKPGETGEICIAGNGVTRGYLHNDAETARHFAQNPFGPGKMYKSGDLGFMRPDGNLEFVKRKDAQIMIHGKRVEPSEVENVMAGYRGIDAVVVKSFLDEHEYPYLVGYFSARQPVKLRELKLYLKNYLPDFMIPEFFVKLDKMPKTENGKLDRLHMPVVMK